MSELVLLIHTNLDWYLEQFFRKSKKLKSTGSDSEGKVES